MSVRAQPPNPMPGRLCVLVYNHEQEDYTLVVDDADHSSYNLGSDVQVVRWYFQNVGKKLLGDRIIDLAREFGMAQGIIADDRVFLVRGEPQRGEKRDASEEPVGKPLIELPTRF